MGQVKQMYFDDLFASFPRVGIEMEQTLLKGD